MTPVSEKSQCRIRLAHKFLKHNDSQLVKEKLSKVITYTHKFE